MNANGLPAVLATAPASFVNPGSSLPPALAALDASSVPLAIEYRRHNDKIVADWEHSLAARIHGKQAIFRELNVATQAAP